jgi:hypothetical protein
MFDHSKSGPGAMDQSFNKGGNNHYNTIVGNCSRHNQFKTLSMTDSFHHFPSLWVDDSGHELMPFCPHDLQTFFKWESFKIDSVTLQQPEPLELVNRIQILEVHVQISVATKVLLNPLIKHLCIQPFALAGRFPQDSQSKEALQRLLLASHFHDSCDTLPIVRKCEIEKVGNHLVGVL